jgi:hypothetical protein
LIAQLAQALFQRFDVRPFSEAWFLNFLSSSSARSSLPSSAHASAQLSGDGRHASGNEVALSLSFLFSSFLSFL